MANFKYCLCFFQSFAASLLMISGSVASTTCAIQKSDDNPGIPSQYYEPVEQCFKGVKGAVFCQPIIQDLDTQQNYNFASRHHIIPKGDWVHKLNEALSDRNRFNFELLLYRLNLVLYLMTRYNKNPSSWYENYTHLSAYLYQIRTGDIIIDPNSTKDCDRLLSSYMTYLTPNLFYGPTPNNQEGGRSWDPENAFDQWAQYVINKNTYNLLQKINDEDSPEVLQKDIASLQVDTGPYNMFINSGFGKPSDIWVYDDGGSSGSKASRSCPIQLIIDGKCCKGPDINHCE